jgi:hypothetical protein
MAKKTKLGKGLIKAAKQARKHSRKQLKAGERRVKNTTVFGLNSGFTRTTFVVKKATITQFRRLAKSRDRKIQDLLEDVLQGYITDGVYVRDREPVKAPDYDRSKEVRVEVVESV